MDKVLLGDVAEEVRENCNEKDSNQAIVGLEHLIPGEIRLKKWLEDTNTTFTKVFHKGQVLFGRRRAYLKKAAVAPVDGLCSGDIIVICAKPDKILPELLPFVIQNDDFFDFAVEKSAGSLSPRVKWSRLKEYEFRLPNMQHQKDLAMLLWSFIETKEAYEVLIHQTDELVKSQFMEQFGDPINNFHNLPVTTLKEVTKVPLSYGAASAAVDYDGKTRYIRITDIEEDGSLGNDIKSAENNDDKYLLHDGDILFARSGATVGKTCRFRKRYGRAMYAGFLIRLVPDTEIIDPDYLFIFTKSNYYMEFVKSSQRVVAQPNINAKEYGDLQILLPPLEQQKNFVNFIRQSDKSKFYRPYLTSPEG